jgi:hypothetical protein
MRTYEFRATLYLKYFSSYCSHVGKISFLKSFWLTLAPDRRNTTNT